VALEPWEIFRAKKGEPVKPTAKRAVFSFPDRESPKQPKLTFFSTDLSRPFLRKLPFKLRFFEVFPIFRSTPSLCGCTHPSPNVGRLNAAVQTNQSHTSHLLLTPGELHPSLAPDGILCLSAQVRLLTRPPPRQMLCPSLPATGEVWVGSPSA